MLRNAGTILTIASIGIPRWLSFSAVGSLSLSFFPRHRRFPLAIAALFHPNCTPYNLRLTSLTQNGQRNDTIGLHSRWRSFTGRYEKFPLQTDCINDEKFCSMWRTVGFLMSFEVVLELCALSAFIVVIAGGVQRRASGWKVVCSILLLGGVVQCAATAIVVCLSSQTLLTPACRLGNKGRYTS